MKRIFAMAFLLMVLAGGRTRWEQMEIVQADKPSLYLVMEQLIPASEFSVSTAEPLIALTPPPGPIHLLPEKGALLSDLSALPVKI